MKATQLLEQIDRDGGVVYPDGSTFQLVCWAGEKAGRAWFHLGDKPTWGPRIADLTVDSVAASIMDEKGGLRFYLTTVDEAPEIRPGEARDQIAGMREEMTREQAEAMLGDPPENDSWGDTAPAKAPPEENPPA